MRMVDYKKEVEEKFGKCDRLTVKKDTTVKNSEGTSKRKAYKGMVWIYYWRAMTGFRLGRMKCSSCGKEIYTGLTYLMKEQELGDKAKQLKAEGGHVWVPTPKDNRFKGGWYITPLCPGCNAKRGQHIPLLQGSKLCKELGATIVKE